MILLLLLGSVMSQLCINLDANSPCGPSFDGAPVAFTSLEQFLANMEVFSNISSTIEEINSVGTCSITNDDALKQQYQSSFFCAYMVEDALINDRCTSVPPFVPEKAKLCSRICDVAKNSVSKTLSSCRNPKNITDGLDFFCSKSTQNDDCFSGIKSEADFCGFRTREAAAIGCPALREDELDAACCKQLIPGVVLLPPKENQSGMTMTIGIGIAVGVAAFLIIAALLASFVWLVSPSDKRKSNGNSILKNNTSRDSLSSTDTSTTYSMPVDTNSKKPVEFETNALPQRLNNFKEFKDGSQIGMGNPYQSSVKINQNHFLAPPPLNRRSMMSVISEDYTNNRQTIDLDLLDVSGLGNDPTQYVTTLPMAYPTPVMNTISNRDSGMYMRNGNATQSMYSNILREQFAEVETVRGSVMYGEAPSKNFESMYTMSTDQSVADDNRDSLSIKFPSPPNNPPKK